MKNQTIIITTKNEEQYVNINSSIFTLPDDINDIREYKSLESDNRIEEGWYYIDITKEKDLQNTFLDNLCKETSSLSRTSNIKKSNYKYLISKEDNWYMIQVIRKSSFLNKKFLTFSDKVEVIENKNFLLINDEPDCIYDENTKRLFFRDIKNILSTFPELKGKYGKEASDEEVKNFLAQYVVTKDFESSKVKTFNKQRIFKVNQIMKNISDEQKRNLFFYSTEYLKDMKTQDNKFVITSDKDLKLVLYGLQQRFYKQPLDDKKMVAESVVSIDEIGNK